MSNMTRSLSVCMKRAREQRESAHLNTLFEGGGRYLSEEDVREHMQRALRSNADDALSILLSELQRRDKVDALSKLLIDHADALIDVAVEAEASECLLMLLNAIYSVDYKRRDAGTPPIVTKEGLVMKAMGVRQDPGQAFEDGGKRRVVRVLLLHYLRMQPYEKLWKVVKNGGVKAGGHTVQWPSVPKDFPPEMCAAQGVKAGGFDLSDGAEVVPVQWVNEVDDSAPDHFVYVRRCIAADVHPDWLEKQAKKCDFDSNTKGAVATEGKRAPNCEACKHRKFPGKPDGTTGQCNWSCRCPLTCVGRELERGSGLCLQVFKHRLKGWCLRTLSPIAKGQFIMEYCGERVSSACQRSRKQRIEDMEVYCMDLLGKGEAFIDAFHVRNTAAFAAFACCKLYANMEKQPWLSSHWDKQLSHVAFVATRDIQPGEELEYMRRDGETPGKSSTMGCRCGRPDCQKRV